MRTVVAVDAITISMSVSSSITACASVARAFDPLASPPFGPSLTEPDVDAEADAEDKAATTTEAARMCGSAARGNTSSVSR